MSRVGGNASAARGLAQRIGPGLITGAADDDPSGIATYSQAGAQFGYSLLWTTVLTTPLMIGIQLASARIGFATGRGLGANLRRVYARRAAIALVALLLIANTVNIAADLAAMGDAVELLVGGPQHLYSVGFGVLCVLLQVLFPYRRYVRVLKWLTVSLLAYVAVAFSVAVPWGEVAWSIVWPQVQWNASFWMVVVGVLGTTISPYLFFWQASLEAEEMRGNYEAEHLRSSRRFAAEHLYRIKLDTMIGMVFSNVIAFAIMLSAAAALHANGITDVSTSAQAAQALRPIAGEFSFVLFAAGIIGTGLLAVPVLAGSAAYALSDALELPASIDLKLRQAREFYAIIVLATAIGAALNFTRIDPMQALVGAAVLNGLIAVPIMAATLAIARNEAVMGELRIGRRTQALGWAATAVMLAAVIAMLVSLL